MVEFLAIILLFFSGLVALFAYYLLKHHHHNKPDSPYKLPNGNMGWPLFGETLSFLKPHKSNTLGIFLQQHCSRYGKVFRSHLFGYPTIVSCDFELNSFILQNEGKLFPVDYPKVMHKILGNYTLVLVTGELHKKLKSNIVNFVSATKSQPNFFHCVETIAFSRIQSWHLEYCNKQVPFYLEAKRFSMNVMLKHLLNITPEDPLASTILEYFDNYMKGFVSLPLNIPGTAYSKALQARIKLSSIIKDIIMKRIKGNVNNVVPLEGDDLLNVILSKENLCDDEKVSIVLDLLFGGYETTARLLSLTVYFLGGATNALQRLKEEHQVIRKSKKGELLDWEDYKQMEFTHEVINEASRCGNVVKFLHRKAVEDVKYKEFVIPAGWKVLPVLSAVHLDPIHFENPEEFNPFRWKDNSTSKNVLAAFSGGPRLCPAADLAKVEIAFFLHHLVLNYRWKINAEEQPLAFPYVEFAKEMLLDLEPTMVTTFREHP